MIGRKTNPSLFKNDEWLRDAPVLQNTVRIGTRSEMLFHMHEFIEIGIVVSGRAMHCLMNEERPCRTGDVYIINAGVPHMFYSDDSSCETIVRNVLFDPARVFEGAAAEKDSPRYCCGTFQDDALAAYVMLTDHALEEVGRLCEKIGDELAEKREGWEEALRAQLTILLVTLRRYGSQDIRTEKGAPLKDRVPVLAVMREVIEHYGEKELTLDALAEQLFFSKSHLSKLFTRVTGEHFSVYLRNFRLNQARQFLARTQLTNAQVAQRCGFRDLPSFYQLFRGRFGMSPNQYRREGLPPELPVGGTVCGSGEEPRLAQLAACIETGALGRIEEQVQQAIGEGLPAQRILDEGLLPGMQHIGDRFKAGEVYIPELLLASRAMQTAMKALDGHLVEERPEVCGRVCIGTVRGDLHDIGKNLVRLMMEARGLQVIDLGTDVLPETFARTAAQKNCDVICCSALLTTTAGVMADVVKEVQQAGIRDRVFIMVGGPPVNEEFCRKIGADAYTGDAASAAKLAAAYCSRKKEREAPLSGKGGA